MLPIGNFESLLHLSSLQTPINQKRIAPREEPIGPIEEPSWITPVELYRNLYLSLAKRVSEASVVIPSLAILIAEYALHESVTDWCRVLLSIKIVPQKLPPLPENILEMLDLPCRFFGEQIDPETGESYKVKKTHFLFPILEEFRTIDHLEKNILTPYAKANYGEENPFKICWYSAYGVGSDPFARTRWVLMLVTGMLPGSQDKTWDEQTALLETSNLESGIAYQIPNIQDAYAVGAAHKLCKTEGQEEHFVARTNNFAIGRFHPTGVLISIPNAHRKAQNVGIIVFTPVEPDLR